MILTEDYYETILNELDLDDDYTVYRVTSTDLGIFIACIDAVDYFFELYGPAPTASKNDALNWVESILQDDVESEKLNILKKFYT